MPIVYPQDIEGRTFLLDKEVGQSLRARIVKSAHYFEGDLARHSSRLKFFCSMNDGTIEEIFTYNKKLDHIKNSEEDDLIEWRFKEVIGHE